MKKSSPPCRIGSVLKKTQPGFCRAGPKRRTAGPPGPGRFTPPFLSEQYSSDRPSGAGEFRRSGRPDAFIIAKATPDS